MTTQIGPSSILKTNNLKSTFFFFNDTAPTEIYTLPLPDALPIYPIRLVRRPGRCPPLHRANPEMTNGAGGISPYIQFFGPSLLRTFLGRSGYYGLCWLLRERTRSEEHTSELQSQSNLVCRLLLEK